MQSAMDHGYGHGQQQFSGMPSCLNKMWQEPFPPHDYTTSSLNCWNKRGWIPAFMLFALNSDLTIRMLHQKTRYSSDQVMLFQSSIIQYWWDYLMFSVFCIQRSSSAYLYLLLFTSHQLEAVWPFSSGQTVAYGIFSLFGSILFKP